MLRRERIEAYGIVPMFPESLGIAYGLACLSPTSDEQRDQLLLLRTSGGWEAWEVHGMSGGLGPALAIKRDFISLATFLSQFVSMKRLGS